MIRLLITLNALIIKTGEITIIPEHCDDMSKNVIKKGKTIAIRGRNEFAVNKMEA